MSVTYSRKRYISVCLGCQRYFDSVRRDQITCSPACRVKSHRMGEAKRVQAIVDFMDVRLSPSDEICSVVGKV